MADERLRGLVVLVTGGGGGLGSAISANLAGAGCKLLVGDIRLDRAEDTARAARKAGAEALALRLDVADEAMVEAAVEAGRKEFGGIDVLINNAGIDVTLPLQDLSVSQWDQVLEVNLRGPFIMAKKLLPLLLEGGRGHIVNIISTAGKRAWPNASAYHASKWGLLGLSHALHAELRPRNIRVTAVIAGGMRTPFLLDRFPDIDVTRLQEPASVAETVRFVLCQPEGTVIPEVMVLPMGETSWP